MKTRLKQVTSGVLTTAALLCALSAPVRAGDDGNNVYKAFATDSTATVQKGNPYIDILDKVSALSTVQIMGVSKFVAPHLRQKVSSTLVVDQETNTLSINAKAFCELKEAIEYCNDAKNKAKPECKDPPTPAEEAKAAKDAGDKEEEELCRLEKAGKPGEPEKTATEKATNMFDGAMLKIKRFYHREVAPVMADCSDDVISMREYLKKIPEQIDAARAYSPRLGLPLYAKGSDVCGSGLLKSIQLVRCGPRQLVSLVLTDPGVGKQEAVKDIEIEEMHNMGMGFAKPASFYWRPSGSTGQIQFELTRGSLSSTTDPKATEIERQLATQAVQAIDSYNGSEAYKKVRETNRPGKDGLYWNFKIKRALIYPHELTYGNTSVDISNEFELIKAAMDDGEDKRAVYAGGLSKVDLRLRAEACRDKQQKGTLETKQDVRKCELLIEAADDFETSETVGTLLNSSHMQDIKSKGTYIRLERKNSIQSCKEGSLVSTGESNGEGGGVVDFGALAGERVGLFDDYVGIHTSLNPNDTKLLNIIHAHHQSK